MGGGGQPNAPDQNISGASLDRLPTEIKIYILLNLPDPSSLRALVRASPSYHELYAHQRQLLLSTSLLNNLHLDGLYTALTVDETSRISHAPDEYGSLDDLYESRKALRVRYFEQPSSKCLSWQWLQGIDFDTLISVIHRHWIITAIACRYFAEKVSTNPVTGELESAASHSQPSRSESHRIHRALYHFELYCLLFVSHHISESEHGQYGSKVTLHYTENQFSVSAFFPLLESWEIEEIACIREYIMSHYSIIFQNCELELQRKEIESAGRSVSLNGCKTIDLNRIWTLEEVELRKEYLLSCGLEVFSALSETSTAEEQAAIIFAHPWRRDNFLTNAILAYRDARIGDLSTQRGDRYRVVIPFISDSDGPNAALPWSRFSDLNFFYKGRDFLRSWGYVMWDLKRLKEWGVLDQDPEVWLARKEVAPRLRANVWGGIVRD